MTQHIDPLAQLRPLMVPDTINWWPVAPGWIILILLAVSAIIVGAIWFHIHNKNIRWRKAALSELKQIKNTETKLWIQVNLLLKRLALQQFEHIDIAHLSGQKWLEFLDNTLPKSKRNNLKFNSNIGTQMIENIYQTKTVMTTDTEITATYNQLLSLTEYWILHHQLKK